MAETIAIMGDRTSAEEPGRLGSVLLEEIPDLSTIQTVSVTHTSELDTEAAPDLLVYSRKSDTTFPEAVDFCQDHRVPLLFVSTDFDPYPYLTDALSAAPFINAPNVSLDVLAYVDKVQTQAAEHPFANIRIVEHHQPSKPNVSGTARKIANLVGVSEEAIQMERVFERTQRQYPQLTEGDVDGGYAIHEVYFEDDSGQPLVDPLIEVIIGRTTYAKGTIAIFEALRDQDLREELAGKRVSIVDFYRDVILARQQQ